MDNPFEKFQKYVDDLDQQPAHIQMFFADVQNILEDAMIESKKTQASFLKQYIDGYDKDADTALNESLDITRLTIADMQLYLAASCIENDGDDYMASFADAVRENAETFDEAANDGIGWQLREYNSKHFNEAANVISEGVSYTHNLVGALFLRDFSRRLDGYLGANQRPQLVIA